MQPELTHIDEPGGQAISAVFDRLPGLPVILQTERLAFLIIGGGHLATELLQELLHASPKSRIRVVAKEFSGPLRELVPAGNRLFELRQKAFEERDLEGISLVVCAVSDPASIESIRSLTAQKGLLLHMAAVPEYSNFQFDRGAGHHPAEQNESRPPYLPHDVKALVDHLAGRNQGGTAADRKELERLTQVLLQQKPLSRERKAKRIATYSLIVFACMLIGHFIFSYIGLNDFAGSVRGWYGTLDQNFHWIVLAGFLAQLVDGALGMGYGVTSATILLSAGISPASISGSIHTAEMFASGASGYSHYKFGNVNKKLFKTLVIPGVIGAVIGALFLTWLGGANSVYLRVAMAAYTLFLGVKILMNGFQKKAVPKKITRYGLLAGAGGFLDSFGGGGWGPIVTTTLITSGRSPKYVIGSVSLTEFFVTFASAFTFFTLLGISHWQVILALILGGLLAAPLAAKLAGCLPRRTSFLLLGMLVIIWSLRIIIKLF